MEEPMKQKMEIKNIISITVLSLIGYPIGYPNLKGFRLFILQYIKKKVMKKYILLKSFFTG